MADGNREAEDEVKAIEGTWKKFKTFISDLNKRKQHDDNDGEIIAVIDKILEEIKNQVLEIEDRDPKEEVKTSEDEVESENESPSSDDSSDSSGPSISDSEDGEILVKQERKKYKRKSTTAGNETVQGPSKTQKSDMDRLLTKLDNRLVLELDPFNEDGKMGLKEYLTMFEDHYQENYKGRKYFWLKELGKYLEGDLLQIYTSIRENEDEYPRVKAKLLKYFENEKCARRRRAKKKFQDAKMKAGENILMYANRLMSLFKNAYPNKNVEKSDTLISNFQKTIPKRIRKRLSDQILHYKLRNKRITWKKVLKFAEIMHNNENSEEDEAKEEEVIKINLSKPVPHSHPSNEWPRASNEWQPRRYSPNQGNDYKFKDQGISSSNREMCYDKCNYCGKFGHAVEICRKKLRSCFKCGKPGHFAKDCWNGKNFNRALVKRGDHQNRQKMFGMDEYSIGVHRSNIKVVHLSNICKALNNQYLVVKIKI